MPPNKKTLTPEDAFTRLSAYCAWQERCRAEVKQKLRSLEVPDPVASKVIEQLEDEGFLDEARFARAFAGGKFRQNKWGKTKIAWQLKGKGISESLIRAALAEIESDDYFQTLSRLCQSKWDSLPEEEPLARRQKVMAYLLSKGFEPGLISEALAQIARG